MTNWRTTFSGIGVAISAALTTLAMIPNDTGFQYIPDPWRSRIIIAGGLAGFILRIVNSIAQKDNQTES